MTRTEHLLWILAEECNEVAQRASKAARFGLTEIQPGQELTNAQRIVAELNDLGALMLMLRDEGHIHPPPEWVLDEQKAAKIAKVERYLRYSAECGTLNQLGE